MGYILAVDANLLDALLVIGLAWAAFRGWQTGLMRSVVGLAGLLFAYFGAFYYGSSAGALLDDGTLGAIAGIAIVFILVLLTFYFIGRIGQAFLQTTPLGIVDTLFGALGVSAAAQGTMNNFIWGNDRHQYYETICGGAGATASADGCGIARNRRTSF